MAKTFYADPNRACIYQGNDDVILNPASRLADVFFHTDFRYFREVVSGSTTVNFPAYTGTSTTATTFQTTEVFVASGAGAGSIPIVFEGGTNIPLQPVRRVYWDGFSARVITIRPTSTGLYLVSAAAAYQLNTLPAYSISLSYVFGVVA